MSPLTVLAFEELSEYEDCYSAALEGFSTGSPDTVMLRKPVLITYANLTPVTLHLSSVGQPRQGTDFAKAALQRCPTLAAVGAAPDLAQGSGDINQLRVRRIDGEKID